MTENRIAKILKMIGIIEGVCGLVSAIYSLVTGEDIIWGWGGFELMLLGFITCMLFVGFGEIINLLQKNVDKQEAILSCLKEKPVEEKTAQKTVLQDIESNLPQM